MIQHEVQAHVDDMPIQQGFTLGTLLARKPVTEHSKLWQLPVRNNKATWTHKKIYNLVESRARAVLRKMLCTKSVKVPGVRARIYWREDKPTRNTCSTCIYNAKVSHGCVVNDKSLRNLVFTDSLPTLPKTTSISRPQKREVTWRLF